MGTQSVLVRPHTRRQLLDPARWLSRFADPDIRKVVPYFLFGCMLDSQTTPGHWLLNGGIAPIEWPGWNRFAPPLGEDCRCDLFAITAPRARALFAQGTRYFDLAAAPPAGAGPAPGWERKEGSWAAMLARYAARLSK